MFDMVPFRRNNDLKRGDYFDQMVRNFFGDDFMSPFDAFSNNFRVDLKETDDSYIVAADLPGIKKDAINIDYENNYLTISAKRDDSTEQKDENGNFVRRERKYGEFKRSFYIDNVDETNIDASFKDGVLTVNLPKQQKGIEHKRKIDIH